MRVPYGKSIASISLSVLLFASILAIINNTSYAGAEEQAEANTATSSSASDEVAAASGSNRFVVWYDSTLGNHEIFFRRSADNGATWQSKVNISNNPGFSGYPQIAVSGSYVYVVWFQVNAGGPSEDIFFRRSLDNGVTWGAKINISLSGNVGFSHGVQVAASGSKVYVAWRSAYEDGIFFRRSTDNGEAWQTTINLSSNAGSSHSPQIAVSGSNVYVVWYDSTPGYYDIHFRRSTDNGATWKLTVNLSNNYGTSSLPQIAVSGTKVYVVWNDDAPGNYDIFFRRSTDNGATWKLVRNLSNNAVTSYNPQIAASSTNVYVVWEDGTPGNIEVFFRRSTDNGATWKLTVNLSNNPGRSLVPQIAVSGSNLYVAWDQKNQNDTLYDVFFRPSTDSGATWKSVKNLSSNGHSRNPDPAASGSSVYVVWEDVRPGDFDRISFMRSTDNAATWKAVKNLSGNTADACCPQIGL